MQSDSEHFVTNQNVSYEDDNKQESYRNMGRTCSHDE